MNCYCKFVIVCLLIEISVNGRGVKVKLESLNRTSPSNVLNILTEILYFLGLEI